jgi:hypothetical protein
MHNVEESVGRLTQLKALEAHSRTAAQTSPPERKRAKQRSRGAAVTLSSTRAVR